MISRNKNHTKYSWFGSRRLDVFLLFGSLYCKGPRSSLGVLDRVVLVRESRPNEREGRGLKSHGVRTRALAGTLVFLRENFDERKAREGRERSQKRKIDEN